MTTNVAKFVSQGGGTTESGVSVSGTSTNTSTRTKHQRPQQHQQEQGGNATVIVAARETENGVERQDRGIPLLYFPRSLGTGCFCFVP